LFCAHLCHVEREWEAMHINADLGQRAVVDSERLPWVDSPLPGVQRRMLERDGEEVARATSIVRYAPGSAFAPHTHGGGEEFFVLEGVFSDESGDFGPGTYVRNPPGSSHTPSSAEGCTIFVKLRQMAAEDQEHVRVDTEHGAWQAGASAGVSEMPLFRRGSERVRLVRFAPGTRIARHEHPGGEEILVLSGAFEDEDGRYGKGTWLRNPVGSSHGAFSPDGCTLFIKSGHLPA
jgi:anti-sigma factor ChrR (cupin superfamily)